MPEESTELIRNVLVTLVLGDNPGISTPANLYEIYIMLFSSLNRSKLQRLYKTDIGYTETLTNSLSVTVHKSDASKFAPTPPSWILSDVCRTI